MDGRTAFALLALVAPLALHCGDDDTARSDDGGPGDGDARDVEIGSDADATADGRDDGAPPEDGIATEDGPGGDDGSGSCTTPDAIEELYGNGAFAISGNWSWGRMAVRVTGCGGRPVPGTSVLWEVRDTIGVLSEDPLGSPSPTLTVTSDTDGVARATFRCPSSMPNPADSNDPGTVHVGAGAASLDYVVTAFNSCPIAGCASSPPLQPAINLTVPEGRDLGTHGVGEILTAGIQVQVANATGWEMGRPVADIGLRLVEPDDSATEFRASAVARCAGGAGTVLSDASGLATCDVEIIGSGASTLRVLVGENIYWNVSITVTP